jgi:transmembrane sensor
MEESPDLNEEDHLFAEANRWFFRLRAEDVSLAERQAFREWLEQGPAHRKAWTDVNALTQALRQPALASYGNSGGLPKESSLNKHSASFLRWIPAGFIAIVVTAGAFIGRDLIIDWRADYLSGIGKRSSVTLDDGTKVELDSDTALKVDMTNFERRITILRGEAFFEVSKSERPFVVAAGGGEIRDVGTAFDVDEGDISTVSVETGLVDVRLASKPDDQLRLMAGQSVNYGTEGLSKIQAIDFDTDVAWRHGKIVFRQQKLSDLVTKLNRYRRGRIIIINPWIRDEVVSGTFNIDQPDSAIEALKSLLGIQAVALTPYVVLLK